MCICIYDIQVQEPLQSNVHNGGLSLALQEAQMILVHTLLLGISLVANKLKFN